MCSSGIWDTVASVHAPRSNMRCVNCQNNVVLAGGHLGVPNRDASNLVQVFDPCTNLWLQVNCYCNVMFKHSTQDVLRFQMSHNFYQLSRSTILRH